MERGGQDEKKSYNHFLKSSDKSIFCKTEVIRCLFDGRGVNQNQQEAIKLFNESKSDIISSIEKEHKEIEDIIMKAHLACTFYDLSDRIASLNINIEETTSPESTLRNTSEQKLEKEFKFHNV